MSAALLLRLFPLAALPLIEEAVRASGVAKITFRKSLLGIPAQYNPEDNEIEFDPDADWAALAPRASRALGLRVEPDEAALAILLHECGHSCRRRFLPRVNTFFRKLALSDQVDVNEEEEAANQFARERFRKYLWATGRGRN